MMIVRMMRLEMEEAKDGAGSVDSLFTPIAGLDMQNPMVLLMMQTQNAVGQIAKQQATKEDLEKLEQGVTRRSYNVCEHTTTPYWQKCRNSWWNKKRRWA